MDLIEFSDQLGKDVKLRREQAKIEEENKEQAKKDLADEQKRHEENKKQGML